MKQFFLASFCLMMIGIIHHSSYAQSLMSGFPLPTDKPIVQDLANYKFSYVLTFVPDSTKLNSTVKNQLVLLIGKNVSKFFVQNDTKIVKNARGESAIRSVEGRGLGGTEIFKYFKTNKETIITNIERQGYLYEEDISTLNWNITNESMVILSYNCQKATTTFLGRQYEAWFTKDIPINNGPWKLGGLPGLILKANDVQNYYIFECTGIESLKTKIPIVKYDLKYISTTRVDLNKLVKNLHIRTVETLKSMGIQVGSKNGDANKAFTFPYNPLERN
jgi:GLPGLI family protein